MIFTKLKTTTVIIIFLLLLILDTPEFIICMHSVPDEILDVPCMLVKGNISGDDTNAVKSLRTIVEMLEPGYCSPSSRKTTPYHALSGIYHAAEIKRQHLYGMDNRQYKDSKEVISFHEIDQTVIFISFGKSGRILSILCTPIPSVLRI